MPDKDGKGSSNSRTLIGLAVVIIGAAVGYGTLLNEVSHKVGEAEYREAVASMRADIEATRKAVERLEQDYRSQRVATEEIQRGVLTLLEARR